MRQSVLLIHYGELGLKGENRRDFVKKLKENIGTKLGIAANKIRVQSQRLLIPLPYGSREDGYLSKLKEIFGIAWFTKAFKIKADLKELKKIALQLTKQIQPNESFAVRVKRANKQFPLSSIEVEKQIGQIVVDKVGLKVNLTSPDKTIFIEIVDSSIYVFWRKHRGLGGLPIGTSGRLLALFSGGIDSPVATWLAAKRGAAVDLVHFCAFPPDKIKDTKITLLHKCLQVYLGKNSLYVIPYVHFQLAISQLPRHFSRYEVLLFRRFMFKVAEELAGKIRAKGLVTGDNLSQVASQTLDNLAVTDRNRDLPVFRPLFGYDKQEIINLAKRIDTYKISIQKYKDCCSLLQKKPVIQGKWSKVSPAETQLDLSSLISQSLSEMVVI